MTKTFKYATCKNCGNTHVTWLQSKAGKWYLADVNAGARGSVYTTPHFQTCTAVGPTADRLRATAEHNAKVEAERAAKQANIADLVSRQASITELLQAGANLQQLQDSGADPEAIIAGLEKFYGIK